MTASCDRQDYTLSGAPGAEVAIARQLFQLDIVPATPPKRVSVDGERLDALDIKRVLSCESVAQVRWPDRTTITLKPGFVARLSFVRPIHVRATMERMAPMPFWLMSTGPATFEWEDYRSPGWADFHTGHGWACAFKGSGHDRLVSRRWLEYGPWRLIRDEANDLSFVQFHDLEADPQTALEQARPGHQRMGISMQGGFLQHLYVSPSRIPSEPIYDAQRGVAEVVMSEQPSDQHYFEACLMRYHAERVADRPIDNFAFVFIDPEDAYASLHELWLRELECWAIIDGEKTRLDDTYQPPPPHKPQWVQDVEAREGG